MDKLPERDAALLLDMLLAARNAARFVAGLTFSEFEKSELHQSAAMRALEVIGEAARGVSTLTQGQLSEIPWRKIIGMRHRLVHGYNDVQLDLVWATIKTDLPPLIEVLGSIVPKDSA